ncbi:heterokaryon incompatibility protein-domain-containing protein [Schizothecium vesticola]|uniref:Heterokaryon incompatibility protein-domain-containing protein n=1 Tax=Schizothecium vesticola TaxID=314040 RepID=A0AA40EUE5_9PEZI|nr:heterokaryon incompatibility protein-domain-containing protein [Schizothecium vesticola]
MLLGQSRARSFLGVRSTLSRPMARFSEVQFAAMSTTTSLASSPTILSLDSETERRLQESANLIKERLNWCFTTHAGTRCTEISDNATAFPKRLIYLGSSTHSIARLVPTPSPLPRYAILSYVWGTEGDNFCTVGDNVEQMNTEIPSSDLPLTLQHVFQLVRHLSLSYLWVDALCIVQDDENDKATEIVNMASTYINAYLQIAAMSSPGAHNGFFAPDDDTLSWEKHHEIMKVCRSLRQQDWNSTLYHHYRLLTRGWTFQERILTRRVVHFTKKELVWECKSARWCECGGIGEGLKDGQALINNMSAALEACMSLSDDMERKGRVSPLWRECVMSYSKRNLGKANDRLPAISGIAALLLPPGGEEEYVAGLWKEAMPFDLLWRCDQTSRLKERKTFKPSWSWGSVHCGVSWPTARQWKEKPELSPSKVDSSLEASLTYLSSGTYFEHGLTGVPVRRMDVEPVSSRLGEIKQGVVVLSSRKASVQIRTRRGLEGKDYHDQTDWIVEGIGSSLPFYPDIQFTEEGQEVGADECVKYWLVGIASAPQGKITWEAGLVVRQAVGHDGAYERVGVAGYSVCEPREGVSWFVSEPEDVMLI